MKTFIINLERQSLKKANIEKICQRLELNYQFIKAIDGYQLSDDYIRSISNDYPKNYLTKGEIGCALSHISVYKEIIDNNLPYALILEDDSVLKTEVPKFLNSFEEKNFKHGIYLLTADFHYLMNKKNKMGEFELYEVTKAVRANGYIITNDAARKLINFLYPIRYEADIFKVFRLCAGIKIYGLIPHLIEVTKDYNLNSSIDADRALLIKQRSEYRKIIFKKDVKKRLISYLFWKIILKKFEKTKYYTD